MHKDSALIPGFAWSSPTTIQELIPSHKCQPIGPEERGQSLSSSLRQIGNLS